MVEAYGRPGLAPRWTSSAKDGVGTALSPLSNVWFTHSHGILDEIYYPRVDQACTRDCGLIVTDGRPGGLFAEEKRDTITETRRMADGIPAFILRNTDPEERFVIEKHLLSDPRHEAVLQRIRLLPADNQPDLRLFVLLAPHLVNGGSNNSGWIGQYKGMDMLFATGDGTSLALACREGFLARSVGFVGASDGWRLLHGHGTLAELYDHAMDGNIALAGEIGHEVLVAIGFGRKPEEAAFQARMSLLCGFERAEAEYSAGWRLWQDGLHKLDPAGRATRRHNHYRISTSIMRVHESPGFPGGSIASLSVPWGASRGDDDLGGYHLVWPRDLVQTAGGMLACGAFAEARRTLDYLRATQEDDGHWPQNCWLDGSPYWRGVQMDETAFPILLFDMARRAGAIPAVEAPQYWEMVRRACCFIVCNGPATAQDRWEENAGYTPATLAVEIAGLLAAADFADAMEQPLIADFLRDTADAWNADIETWIYVTDTDLARASGVSGYYVRIAPDGDHDLSASNAHGRIAIRNRPGAERDIQTDSLIGPDALALVRFGLRDARDPRILDTVTVIDRLTRIDLPQGPVWHRYNDDGYGEHNDGRPFDGTGHGRAWPLLTGERAHYALLAGDIKAAQSLCRTMEDSASGGGLFPEQVWDAADIPELELFRGRPSGSAMPLVWAHAEYVKLLRSLRDGAVFDLPPQTRQRYIVENRQPRLRDWREVWRRSKMPAGQGLRVELCAPAVVRFTFDDWAHSQDVPTTDLGIGVHAVELPSQHLRPDAVILFTWRWLPVQAGEGGEEKWRGENFAVRVTA